MTAPSRRRSDASDVAALALRARPARDGEGYAARERPAPGDPLAWLAEALPDGPDDEDARAATLETNQELQR